MENNNLFINCAKVLAVAFTVWFLLYVPTCSWHAYKDDLACREKSGLYNCEMKSREHKQVIELNQGNQK